MTVPDPTDRPITASADAAPGSDAGERPTTVIPVGKRAGGYGSQPPDHSVVPTPERRRPSFWRELPFLVVIAVVLALLIKTFLVQAFYIPSGSMEQTLHVNDRVLVNKFVYHLRDPHRGEIVVFDTKGTGFDAASETAPCPKSNPFVSGVRSVQNFLGVGSCGDSDFIKRVIAVPGDKVQCCTNQGQVEVNGKALQETYLYLDDREPFCAAPAGKLGPAVTGANCGPNAQPVVVPKGHYWVMGDHRNDSSDSRPNGFVPGNKIVGRAFFRAWPPSRFGFLHVPGTFKTVATAGIGLAAAPALSAPALLVPLVGIRWRRRRPAATQSSDLR